MAVQDLEARQQGNEVILTFTLPNRSTANEPLARPAIEIYRAESDPAKPKQKISPRLVYTIPSEMIDSYVVDGRVVYKDTIEPGDLVRPRGAARVYEVRTREERNRASAESNRVQVSTQAPPSPVEDLQAVFENGSVTLKWASAAQTKADYRVYRAEIAGESAAAAANEPSKANFITPLRLLARSSQPAYNDQMVEFGHTYMYTVRQATGSSATGIESMDSKAAIITPAQVKPPAAPQGLEAIPVPQGKESSNNISLSWDISSEPGIAGYAVYRSEQAQERGNRLNADLLLTPTYRDSSVVTGKPYFYRVTAFDQANNEGEPSEPVEAHLPEQP
jgi:fibronectin type 3 domain-containing protein